MLYTVITSTYTSLIVQLLNLCLYTKLCIYACVRVNILSLIFIFDFVFIFNNSPLIVQLLDLCPYIHICVCVCCLNTACTEQGQCCVLSAKSQLNDTRIWRNSRCQNRWRSVTVNTLHYCYLFLKYLYSNELGYNIYIFVVNKCLY